MLNRQRIIIYILNWLHRISWSFEYEQKNNKLLKHVRSTKRQISSQLSPSILQQEAAPRIDIFRVGP